MSINSLKKNWWNHYIVISVTYFYEKNTFQAPPPKLVKRVELYFANLFNVWLNWTQVDSHICCFVQSFVKPRFGWSAWGKSSFTQVRGWKRDILISCLDHCSLNDSFLRIDHYTAFETSVSFTYCYLKIHWSPLHFKCIFYPCIFYGMHWSFR